jgi:hypothetical protein
MANPNGEGCTEKLTFTARISPWRGSSAKRRRKPISAAGSASPYHEPGELEARTPALADAEARYWATVEEPAATEADRIEVAENLERAPALIRELTCSLPAPDAEPEPEAEKFQFSFALGRNCPPGDTSSRRTFRFGPTRSRTETKRGLSPRSRETGHSRSSPEPDSQPSLWGRADSVKSRVAIPKGRRRRS